MNSINRGVPAPGFVADPNQVGVETMIARGELAPGQYCKFPGGIIIRRGGSADKGVAGSLGLYYAHKDGLSLHQDGTWSKSLRRPGSPPPAPGTSIARVDLTGLFDDLASLLRHLDF